MNSARFRSRRFTIRAGPRRCWRASGSTCGARIGWFATIWRSEMPTGRMLTPPRFHSPSRDAEAGRVGKFSPGGRFENSPAVHCRVPKRQSTSPEGTAESTECHASVPISIFVAVIQPSLRDWMSLFLSPLKGWAILKPPSGRQTTCHCWLNDGRLKSGDAVKLHSHYLGD